MQYSKKINLKISKSLWKRIIKYYANSYTGVLPKYYQIEDYVKQRIDSAFNQILRLDKLGVDRGKFCLDAGGGVGLFGALANLYGYNYYTYDIDKVAVDISVDLFIDNGISSNKVALGCKGFEKNKFDLITSFQVMEHVRDIDQYLNDLRYIISKNGKLFIEAPNYMIPYEPHFYVFLPYGPNYIRWLICKIYGRSNYHFFESLNFITTTTIEKSLRKNGFEFENIGVQEWINEIMKEPSDKRSIYVKSLSNFIHRFKLSWLLIALSKFDFYTPLRYLAYPI